MTNFNSNQSDYQKILRKIVQRDDTEIQMKGKTEDDLSVKKKQIFKEVDLGGQHEDAKDTDSDNDSSELSEGQMAAKSDLMPGS